LNLGTGKKIGKEKENNSSLTLDERKKIRDRCSYSMNTYPL